VALKNIFIKLNTPEELELHKEFTDVVEQNHSDVTKMTKALWKNYIESNKKKEGEEC
jgi:hypothetical protein